MPTLKNIIYSTLFFLSVTIGLSVFADIAYIYTLCGLSGWVAFGHLITLDDDMPGEWSNPEGIKTIWRTSLAILAVKFAVFIGLVVLVLSAPTLAKYGA
ncbi:hypothetical protein [Marinobacter sp.]|uniref:hypothetical protein n=1 Tax=Marinobacter sp. TaxID=50741 RepID=UPI00384B0C3F